jgi:hypothetical protein
MKNRFFTYIMATMILSVCNSCSDGIPEKLQFDKFMSVWLIPARDGNKTVDLYGMRDTTITIPGIRYGGTSEPAGTVTANIAVDESLVSNYNATNNTAYLSMPAGCASLNNSTLTIKANDFVSDAIVLRINDDAKLETDLSYLIPIKVTSVDAPNLPLNETYSTAYIIVNRRPDATDMINEMNEHLKGKWLFDDANPFKATVGEDLIPGYGAFDEFYYDDAHGILPMAGPAAANGAVNVPIGSFLWMNHNIGANGDGDNVNEYSMQFDFRIAESPDTWDYFAFYQTDLTNSNDADFWVNGGSLGLYENESGYGDPITLQDWTDEIVANDKWYRMVVTFSMTASTYKVYLDGVEVGGKNDPLIATDGVFSLDPVSVLLCIDGWGYDGAIDIAEIAIWDIPLSADHVKLLGTVQ